MDTTAALDELVLPPGLGHVLLVREARTRRGDDALTEGGNVAPSLALDFGSVENRQASNDDNINLDSTLVTDAEIANIGGEYLDWGISDINFVDFLNPQMDGKIRSIHFIEVTIFSASADLSNSSSTGTDPFSQYIDATNTNIYAPATHSTTEKKGWGSKDLASNHAHVEIISPNDNAPQHPSTLYSSAFNIS
ncbi:hypothetical protein ETB97_002233 [Aspergillus alliaceus]|uniref:Uncharacterized protein n=1 Tax=Petromyces alliaceus TaxID=209559 RepID=A0A8H6E595_PETAA|nr:hypothetical protein ETB97_002233 [Aspergillus burnettii]